MSKPNDLSPELFKISHGKRKNTRKVRSQSREGKYNRENFDCQKLSFDCVGDLAYWLDSRTQLFSVNQAACVFSGSSHSGLREMAKYYMDPNYPKEGTSFRAFSLERRKTPKGESEGIELRVHKAAQSLLEKNRELQKEIAKRKATEDQIRDILSKKDLLLKEVQHRLKNNLQFITTLIDLHSDYTKDNKMQNVLVDIQNRIKSMALIHEQIYQSKRVGKIDFKEYLENLVNYIFDSYGISKSAIKPKIRGSNYSLCVNSVINCGLIAHELISNALKHGFPNGRQGVMLINMYSKDNNFNLIIGDNGIGFPKDFSFQKITTLGLQLVISLTQQLNGRVKLNRRGGTEFKIMFPEH